MTAIQVNYQNLMEQMRHNREMEDIQRMEAKVKQYESESRYGMGGTERSRVATEQMNALTEKRKVIQQGLTLDSQVFSNYAKGMGDLFKSLGGITSTVASLFV